MKAYFLATITVLFLCIGLRAQIYPTNFLLNGCSYTYNGLSFNQDDTIRCKSGDYQLIFEDNFDDTLDSGSWLTCYPWLGRSLHNSQSGTGWERQYYLDENVYVDNGFLHLVTKVDPGYRPPDPDFPSMDVFFKYTSGMVCSKITFQEGRFETRCKIPYIDGVWPAFWFAGGCAQEIDGFEFINKDETSNANTDSGNMIMSYHKQNHCNHVEEGQCDNGFTRITGMNLSDDFHVYSVEWDENKIIWQLDGRVVREVYRIWTISPPLPYGPLYGSAVPVKDCNEINGSQKYTVFNTFPEKGIGMNFVLNTAVGFDRGDFPKEFLIDYVRIYTQQDTLQSFPEEKDSEYLNVYPNPAKGAFSIVQMDKEDPIQRLILRNSMGQEVWLQNSDENYLMKIDISELPKGIYFAEIICRQNIYLRKIVCN
ncbi:MAG: glycoside hydrolase family 16 [Bacteroidetes bacterium]|nr:glycoside hydrolase family 16 [Bacteroidota bacterium]